MKKIKIFIIIAIILVTGLSTQVVLAAPNYGTTTFFSGKNNENPSVSEPIYDVGIRGGNKISESGNDKNKKTDKSKKSLFDGFGDALGGSVMAPSFSKWSDVKDEESLFDYQKKSDDFQDNSDFDSENLSEDFIMGARGESYENLSEGEAARYNKINSKFNFSNNNSVATPKKSKLIFTNVVIPVDLTTQYIIIFLVIAVAIGLVIGYYFWKKETSNRKYKNNEYD